MLIPLSPSRNISGRSNRDELESGVELASFPLEIYATCTPMNGGEELTTILSADASTMPYYLLLDNRPRNCTAVGLTSEMSISESGCVSRQIAIFKMKVNDRQEREQNYEKKLATDVPGGFSGNWACAVGSVGRIGNTPI